MAAGPATPEGLIPPHALRWHRCQRVRGHGVASGQAAASPYPAGTIALQSPHFARLGLDLSSVYPGTLNLRVSGGRWQLQHPAWHIERLPWTSLHPPETFSFWPCLLRWPTGSPSPGPGAGPPPPLAGWIYRPDPATKARHHQPADQLEVLAPWIGALEQGLPLDLELGVDDRHCRWIPTAAQRGRVLEFLKFRVLAAQESFFTGFQGPEAAAALRRWLARQGCSDARELADSELLAVLQAARDLYLDG